VILEVERDDHVDDTISGWHPYTGRKDWPAFEILSGAERFLEKGRRQVLFLHAPHAQLSLRHAMQKEQSR